MDPASSIPKSQQLGLHAPSDGQPQDGSLANQSDSVRSSLEKSIAELTKALLFDATSQWEVIEENIFPRRHVSNSLEEFILGQRELLSSTCQSNDYSNDMEIDARERFAHAVKDLNLSQSEATRALRRIQHAIVVIFLTYPTACGSDKSHWKGRVTLLEKDLVALTQSLHLQAPKHQAMLDCARRCQQLRENADFDIDMAQNLGRTYVRLFIDEKKQWDRFLPLRNIWQHWGSYLRVSMDSLFWQIGGIERLEYLGREIFKQQTNRDSLPSDIQYRWDTIE